MSCVTVERGPRYSGREDRERGWACFAYTKRHTPGFAHDIMPPPTNVDSGAAGTRRRPDWVHDSPSRSNWAGGREPDDIGFGGIYKKRKENKIK
jgi:hypothetical protein